MADEEGEDARSLRSRRDRLNSLRARHQGMAAGPAALAGAGPARRSAPAAGGFGAGLGGGMAAVARPGVKPAAGPAAGLGAGLFGAPGSVQRQVAAKAYQMLTQGSGDGGEMVAGTPFTRSGVEAFMELLRARAGDGAAPGSKAAQSALRFIEARDGEEGAVGGASLDKLRMLAQRGEAIRAARGGRAGGRGRG